MKLVYFRGDLSDILAKTATQLVLRAVILLGAVCVSMLLLLLRRRRQKHRKEETREQEPAKDVSVAGPRYAVSAAVQLFSRF